MRLPALLLVWLLAGCSTLQPVERQSLLEAGLPAQAGVEAPFFPQEIYQCGPAALATLLTWSGIDTTPERLADQVYLPAREGSLQLELVAAARRAGRIPYVLEPALEALLGEVAAGYPVVVLQNLGLDWYPKWHYAVVIGYDLAAATITLHSGIERGYVTALDTFRRTWQRGGQWALVVLPPGRLPATAQEIPYLKQVSALERIGQWPVAEGAYRMALTRWPQSFAAQMGLGNALYAGGDRDGAIAAFRAALALGPDSPLAHNNLAHVLMEQGALSGALEHARRAVALAGDRLPAVRETLQAIEQRIAAGNLR